MEKSYRERLAVTPRAFSFPLAYLLPLLMIATAVGLPRGSGDFVWLLVNLSALIVIIVMHRRPELRRWKYEAILIGTWALGLDLLTSALGHTPLLLWALAPVGAAAITWPIHRRLFRSNETLPQPRSASLAYQFTHILFGSIGSVILFVLIFYLSSIRHVNGLFLIFFALLVFEHIRYFAGEALTGRPVVYLRAFSQASVFRTFNSVLAPALASRHVLIGLTPTKERKHLIKSRLGLSVASLYIVPDAVWQSWVQTELARAYGVVFDLTVPTENLAWELAEAERVCRPEQIIRLVPLESAGSTSQSSGINVGSSRNQLRVARVSLQAWLASLAAK